MVHDKLTFVSSCFKTVIGMDKNARDSLDLQERSAGVQLEVDIRTPVRDPRGICGKFEPLSWHAPYGLQLAVEGHISEPLLRRTRTRHSH